MQKNKYSLMIDWINNKMKADKIYPVSDDQKHLIIQIWEVIHLQAKYELKFNDEYTQLKKINYDHK